MTPDDLFDLAEETFAKDGLKVTDEKPWRLVLENEKGFVMIQFNKVTNQSLDILTDVYDLPVKAFLKRLK
ncbi:MAG TPA: hypothetical protein VLH13_00285 [Methanomassiliicoccales archaeon]|nr:hypothetical protein [Methanomassiliicoccales archaeon]